MRWLIMISALAACGKAPDGAYLTIDLSAVPVATFDSLAVVLAAPSPVLASNQRGTESATTPKLVNAAYYQQAALGGTFDSGTLSVDELGQDLIAIRPLKGVATESVDVFLIAYSNGMPIGVGTYTGGSGSVPIPISVVSGSAFEYSGAIVVEHADPGAPGHGFPAHSAAIIDCDVTDSTATPPATFPSGLVWQPTDATADQVRLMFPDLSTGGSATSAIGRHHDLDCDTYTVGGGSAGSADADCDDLEPGVFPGASLPACDLDPPPYDVSCGAPVAVTPTTCTYPGTTCGIVMCDSTTGVSSCLFDPSCVCGLGTCDVCLANHVDFMSATACQTDTFTLTIGDECMTNGCSVVDFEANTALAVPQVGAGNIVRDTISFRLDGALAPLPYVVYFKLTDSVTGAVTIEGATIDGGGSNQCSDEDGTTYPCVPPS